MNTIQATVKLDRYIRSRYPLIAVVSYEEDRVIGAIHGLLSAATRSSVASWKPRKVYQWAFTTGIELVNPGEYDNSEFQGPATKDPVAAIGAIIEYTGRQASGNLDPIAVIFRDFHPYFSNPIVVRAVRDLASRFSQGGANTAIFISPSFTVPRELEKTMVLLDWPLPDIGELGAILDKVERQLPDSIPVTLNGSRERVIQAMQGLTDFEATNVLLSAVVATRELGDEIIPHIVAEKKQIIRKSGLLEFYESDVTMDGVGGLENLKRYAMIKRSTFSAKARAEGVDPAKGVLLVGVPGTGKSLSAKAIAGGQMPLLRMDIGALMGGLVGESEANMRGALKLAEAIAPAIVWLDEIEKALGGLGGNEHDGGTSARVFGTLLTWMQETKAPIYIIATANDIRSLRPELLRRFDDIFWVDLPNHEDRKQVFRVHLEKRNRDPQAFDLDALSDATWGFTGAEIEKAVKSGIETAFFDGEELSTDILVESARAIVPISKTMQSDIDRMRNEIGARARLASAPLEDQPRTSLSRTAEL